MLRRLAVVALLTTFAAAPVAGLPEASAQAPNLGSSDAGISRTIDSSAGMQALPSSTSPAMSSSSPATDALTPRSDVPANQNPMITSIPDPEPPAPDPVFIAGPATQNGTATPSNPPIPPTTPLLTSVPSVDETTEDSGEAPSRRDLGAWIPGVTGPVNEPVAERSAAPPAPAMPAPVVAVPQPALAGADAPAATAPEAAEEAPEAVVEEAPVAESMPAAPAAPAAPLQSEAAIVAPLASNPRAVAFVPSGTSTPMTTSNAAAAPAESSEESLNVEVAGTIDDASVAEAPAPPASGMPRLSSPAPAPTISIPALASLDMPGGLNLSLFVVLFGALGSAALGLHLLLRRIEATL